MLLSNHSLDRVHSPFQFPFPILIPILIPQSHSLTSHSHSTFPFLLRIPFSSSRFSFPILIPDSHSRFSFQIPTLPQSSYTYHLSSLSPHPDQQFLEFFHNPLSITMIPTTTTTTTTTTSSTPCNAIGVQSEQRICSSFTSRYFSR